MDPIVLFHSCFMSMVLCLTTDIYLIETGLASYSAGLLTLLLLVTLDMLLTNTNIKTPLGRLVAILFILSSWLGVILYLLVLGAQILKRDSHV